jgi:hypothetical protein
VVSYQFWKGGDGCVDWLTRNSFFLCSFFFWHLLYSPIGFCFKVRGGVRGGGWPLLFNENIKIGGFEQRIGEVFCVKRGGSVLHNCYFSGTFFFLIQAFFGGGMLFCLFFLRMLHSIKKI